MEKTESKERFPLFHSKNCCFSGQFAFLLPIGPDSPTKDPEAPSLIGV